MDTTTAYPPATVTTTIIFRQPPPFPAPPRSVDLSALEFILGLLAVISIPALIYTIFFAIKCPQDPFRPRRQISSGRPSSAAASDVTEVPKPSDVVKYKKERDLKEMGEECPVCLMGFCDGEDVKALSECKHAFHSGCINPWLDANSNCPVCRASIAVAKRSSSSDGNSNSSSNSNSNSRVVTRSSGRDDDRHQGLPDSSNLV